MHNLDRLRTALTVLGLCLACIGTACAADSLDIEAALSSAVDFEFVETPLDEALTDLSRRYRVPFAMDERSLQRAGVQLDKIPITRRINDVPLGKALAAILEPYELDWITRHDVVLVTTATAAADEYYETRVYKITRSVPVERRMRSIMGTVAPTSWVTAGGAGDAAPLPPKLLIVSQSPLRHREIARRFADSVMLVRAEQTIASSGIEKTLETSTTIDFEAAPLLDAVGQLGSKHSVKISVDRRALHEAGIFADGPIVTLRVGKMRSLASGLSLLLETVDRELEWIVDADAIEITTAKSAESRLSRRTYDLRGILPEGGVDQLLQAIQYTIAASSWEDVGGDAKIAAINENASLDILQSDPVHRTLQRLFAELRVGSAEKRK